MEKLIKAYLKHIGHYLADADICNIHSAFDGDECIYEVEVRNDCSASGCDIAMIAVSDLLVFLFERQT